MSDPIRNCTSSSRELVRARVALPTPFVCVLSVLAGIAAFSPARNLQAQSIDQSVQLSLNANLLTYDSVKLSSAGSSASGSDTSWGPGTSGLGFGLGYGVTDNWLIGVQLLGGSTSASLNSPGSTDSKLTSYSVLPSAQYVFASDSVIRPYLGATLGLRGSSTAGAGISASASDFVFGGVAGLRAFATPGFSIDPSVALLGSTGKEDLGTAALDRNGFTFLLSVAFSGWLSTSAPQAHSALAPAPGTPAGVVASTKVSPTMAALAEPEATLETDDDGTMRLEIVIADRGRVRLVGRPMSDGHDVLLELLGAGVDSLTKCRALAVLVDGDEQSTSSVPRPVAGSSNALQLLITPKIVELLSDAKRSASFAVCGADWEISAGARSVTRRFFEGFRDGAQRYGRWASNDQPEEHAAR